MKEERIKDWTRRLLSRFILFVLKSAGLFVSSSDGTWYIISPKFIRGGLWTAGTITAGGYNATTLTFSFDHVPRVFGQLHHSNIPDTSAHLWAFRTTAPTATGVTLYLRNNSAGPGTMLVSWMAVDFAFIFKLPEGGGI